MSYLRIQAFLLVCLSLTSPSFAAVNVDLDPRLLLMQTTDKAGRCREGSGGAGADGCCGTSFQSMTGSISSRGAKNLCFGAQSISAISSGAVSQSTAQQITPPVVALPVGGGGASSERNAAVATTSLFGDGSSEAGSLSIFSGGGGGGGNVGAPGPTAGAGLPFLLLAGGYALLRRRRSRAAALGGSA